MVTELEKRNALAEIEELAAELGREFTDQDVADHVKAGTAPFGAAAHYIVETYTGNNSFMRSQVHNVANGRGLTVRQIRAVVNIHTGKGAGATKTADAVTPPHARTYKCFTYKKEIVGRAEIQEHGRLHTEGVLDNEGNIVEEVAVIEVTTSTMDLDLSFLPNGRYAAPNLKGTNDLIFLMVTRTRRDKRRDRRYRYGKFITGREIVPKNTIEVKEWSSDQKRLVGQQKPGDEEVYKGEYEEQLQMILENPEAWAKLFGLMVGHCYICGKTLTDEESRAMGIGPECVKKNNYFGTRPTVY